MQQKRFRVSEIKVITPDIKEFLFKIDQVKLVQRYLGLKHADTELNNKKVQKFLPEVRDFFQEIVKHKLIKPAGVYRLINVKKEQDCLQVMQKGKASHIFCFPRKKKNEDSYAKSLECLVDLVGDEEAKLYLFVITCGLGVREKIEMLNKEGQYLKSMLLNVIALEAVEKMADYTENLLLKEFMEKEKGREKDLKSKRFSLGYPLCPDLRDQEKFWQLLAPDKHLGISLTSSFLMLPEASISAFLF
jgi:5-methyltetrahydrofolate--homocysteine methyltransferase